MGSSGEWKQHKLHSLECLRALSFYLADYAAPSKDWDHDHCKGCWAKFAELDAPDILHTGYFTTTQPRDKPPEEPELIKKSRELGHKVIAKSDAKIWVCKECFEEFRETLGWKLKSATQI